MRRTAHLIGVAALFFGGLAHLPAVAQAQDIACAVAAPAADGSEGAYDVEGLAELRRLATGAGVKVAVIDTGVARNPQLDQLAPGADFVTPDDPQPFLDCDVHGTVVAGIIAGTQVGIAPDAEILAIRQSSAHYRAPRDPGENAAEFAAAGTVETLSHAIHNALDEGARVINMSVVSCLEPAVAPRVDTRGLVDALNRAEHDGAVVIAAAGNTNPDCPPGSMVFPAHFPTVLAVGARADTHTLTDYSLPVPDGHLLLSAPGRPAIALSPGPDVWATGIAGDRGAIRPFEGTSFAAPVVSGTAALLKQRYPDASAAQIRAIIAAAAEPSGGAVDPLHTLTFLGNTSPLHTESTPLVLTPEVKTHSPAPLRAGIVLGVLMVAGLLVTAVASASQAFSRSRSTRLHGSTPGPRATSG
ncbi:S8 family serine peptidase [Corynebacterium sp. MSK044]|uniref:S8 family serine peptidase n=1 Tax=Corynebacterium sp. MSK044 TaxID=3050195 RepID=UPI002551023F|nr:S8 family serine peptidase [Corynebacterium sp. MSK044]MDK8797046.1 S8 family serine peptidase [Corynebacterium sp. MSK044]